MHTERNSPAGDRQPAFSAIARAQDAQIAVIQTHLTEAEAERLKNLLGQLVELGALAFYRLDVRLERATCWQQLLEMSARAGWKHAGRRRRGGVQVPCDPHAQAKNACSCLAL
ncbi:hypothetical protein [Sphingomonas bacterium]|uniref:hypothetical protein n=1 Tax=Sphingomonas bacterium TaxID=1895847 RepID=UPI00262F2C2F|nr:hypothetical protein [Sphingomonas bacterium]